MVHSFILSLIMVHSFIHSLMQYNHGFRRGASGGLTFAKSLGLSLDLGGSNRNKLPVKCSLPSLVIPPRSTAMIPPSQVRTTILHLCDVGSPARMNAKEKQDTFRTLQKYLTQVEEVGHLQDPPEVSHPGRRSRAPSGPSRSISPR